VYKKKPIFYSLGNFIYDSPGKLHADWNEGFVVRLHLTNTIDFDIIPLKQNNEQPGVFLLNEQETTSFNEKIGKLNATIADDGKVAAAFNSYCTSVQRNYEAYIEPNFGNTIASLRARGFFPKLMSKRKKLLLLNIARCEAHREVLLNLLSKY